MDEHPFKRTSHKEHFPPFSGIFDNKGADVEEEEDDEVDDMEMSIDLVATLRGDQLDPTITNKNCGRDWDLQDEAQCSEFFRDERRMEMLKTPVSTRKSKEDEMIRLLRDLTKRVSAIETHLKIQEPDEKIPNSPRLQKSPVMRRRKYTPSASSRKQPQQQFGLSPIPSMLGSPARRRGIAKTPVAPWLTPKNSTTQWTMPKDKTSNNTTTTRLDFEDDEEEEEDRDTSMLDTMDLKVSAASKSSHSPIQRNARYWRERLGSAIQPLDTASILRRSELFRRSWG